MLNRIISGLIYTSDGFGSKLDNDRIIRLWITRLKMSFKTSFQKDYFSFRRIVRLRNYIETNITRLDG